MDASVTFLLENLKQLLVYHIKLIAGAKTELKLLQNELELMKGELEDASEIHNKNEVFIKWENQIRDVVYEVEDTIDACVIEAAVKKSKSSKILNTFLPNSLAEKVKDLRVNRVKPLFEETITHFAKLASTPVGASQTRHPQIKDKRNNKDPRQDNVVGLKDETDTLIGYINEESEELEVISIIGMPGLGKTTIAWKIYQDSTIKYEFPTLIWVYISNEFNKRDMLLTILKKFTNNDMSASRDEDLAKKVKEFLKRGKFLIFMDDVWTPQVWCEIKKILPMENKMGKVVITSRHDNVARSANPRREPHRLRFLNAIESWELLQLEVDGKVGGMDEGLELTGKHIANKCHGLPLSIIVIGGILVDKLSTLGAGGYHAWKDEWKKVSEGVESYLSRFDKEKLLENIISLSYTELPYDLRDCFLYLGMFPEDPVIPAWKLTRLWIAEGFIQEKLPLSLEEVAQDNLKDLINRNLVMVHSTKPDGEVKTCRIHDTIREFCRNEADLKRQNLFQEIISNKGVFEPTVENIGKFRRICVHSFVHDFLLKKPKLVKARSFLCFSKSPIILGNDDIANITNAFNLLRVLETSTIKFPKFPTKITNLIHLRYLTLSSDDLLLLPEAIAKLWNLQTLIVDTSSRSLLIKADIWMLMQLRHLKTKASITLTSGKGDGGENLQTLGRLSPQSCTVEVFTKAKKLNTLGIRGDLLLLSNSDCLKKLAVLNKLKLVHDAFPKVASENPLGGLPRSIAFPPKLRTLILSSTYLSWEHISTLGKLRLEVLKLKDHAFMGNFWDAFDVGFYHLEFLYIERTDLTYWTLKGVSFPRLRTLVLKNCEKLEGVPFELKDNLDTLCMERVTPYAVSSARKIQQAKQQMPEQQGAMRESFKLVIPPGDQVHNLSTIS